MITAGQRGMITAGQRGMITAGQRGMITAGQRGTASSAMDPGPAEPAPYDRTGHPGRASVTPRITASRRLMAAPDEPQVLNAAGGAAGLPGHPGKAAAAILGDARPGASAAAAFDAGPAGTPAPVPVAGGTLRPSGTPGEPVVPVAIRTGAALNPVGKESAAATDQSRAEPVISATAGRSAGGDASAAGAGGDASAAGAGGDASVTEVGARGAERYPQHENTAGKHYRATTGVEDRAAADLEGPGSAGVPAPGRRPGTAADQAAVPHHAGAQPGTPLPRRQGDTSAARTSPGTLSIGTIEITVLPPPHSQSPVQPEASRPAPVNPPERLSRGLGPWFGRNQA